MRTASPESRPLRRVLIIEDDLRAGRVLQQQLRREPGLDAEAFCDPQLAFRRLERGGFSVVITDLHTPDVDGLEVIRHVRQQRLPVTVIVMASIGNVDEAVQAVRHGAYDFLPKPIDLGRLRLVLGRVWRDCAMQDELCRLREELRQRYRFHDVLSRSPKMHSIFELVEQVASTTATVLIQGETGTGKEVIARAIHNSSALQRPGQFVPVNCAAFNENLLESELFGHEKGSYTGATGQRKGRFEQAHGGTLFLDEVGDVPASMQIKLLRVLQERTFERVGGTEPLAVDVRIIAATNRDLKRMVRRGEFREDLYYRLDVMRLELPPLRERAEDVPLLAAHFALEHASRDGPVPRVSAAALELLAGHSWPGNVRELENVIERACVTSRGTEILPEDLPALGRKPTKTFGVEIDLGKPLRKMLDEVVAGVEREYLVKALRKTRGHVGRTAKLCGYSRRSITGKLAEYRIDRNEFSDE